jgi:Tfp pilus assembly protein PilN
MKALTLNFAPRTLGQVVAKLPWWCWLVFTVGGLGCVLVVLNLWGLQRQMQPLHEELQSVQSRLDARSNRPKAVKRELIPTAAAVAINTTIGQLNIPWSELLDAMEETATPSIALIELNPDARQHLLRAKAEARTTDDMVAYIERLKRHGLFINVMLSKQEVNAQDRNQPVRFEFEAPWRELPP